MISHAHADHLHRRSLRLVAGTSPGVPVVVPRGAEPYVDGLGLGRVVEVRPGDRLEVAGVALDVTDAVHHGGRGKRDRGSTETVGYVVERSGRRCYLAGRHRPVRRDGGPRRASTSRRSRSRAGGSRLGPGHLDEDTRRRGGGAGRPAPGRPDPLGHLLPGGACGLHPALGRGDPGRRFAEELSPARGSRTGWCRLRPGADRALVASASAGGRWRASRPDRVGWATRTRRRRCVPLRRRGRRGAGLTGRAEGGEHRHERGDLLVGRVGGEDPQHGLVVGHGLAIVRLGRLARGSPSRSSAGFAVAAGPPSGRDSRFRSVARSCLARRRSADRSPAARACPLARSLTAGCSRASSAAASRAWCAAAGASGRSRGGSRGARSRRRRSRARRRCTGWPGCPRSRP